MADEAGTVWEGVRVYASAQRAAFTAQEVISWFRRHRSHQANDRTIRTHIRGACWNVENRFQFATKEPFLTKIAHGTFRIATDAEIERWRSGREGHLPQPAPAPRKVSDVVGDAAAEWHSEENTQRLLVAWLEDSGWTILRTADTLLRERGIDVVAERSGVTVGIEVKGYPSRYYVAGPKQGKRKPTAPSNQARMWFAHALVPAMKLRTQHPQWRSVICFPDFPVYRKLYAETASSLSAASIEMWVVSEDGSVIPLG